MHLSNGFGKQQKNVITNITYLAILKVMMKPKKTFFEGQVVKEIEMTFKMHLVKSCYCHGSCGHQVYQR